MADLTVSGAYIGSQVGRGYITVDRGTAIEDLICDMEAHDLVVRDGRTGDGRDKWMLSRRGVSSLQSWAQLDGDGKRVCEVRPG